MPLAGYFQNSVSPLSVESSNDVLAVRQEARFAIAHAGIAGDLDDAAALGGQREDFAARREYRAAAIRARCARRSE